MASKPERELALHIRLSGLPEPETEHRFHDKRKWRLDFAWPALKIGVEVQGGGRGRGRHHRNEGYRRDCEKLAFAVMEGWKLIYVVPEQIKSGEALHWITELIEQAQKQEVAL